MSVVQSRSPEIAKLCRQFGVVRLDLFGSADTGDFDPDRSDVDFLVEFAASTPLGALDTYFGLKEALEALFGRPVDLVMACAVVNPFLLSSIERTRRPVFAG